MALNKQSGNAATKGRDGLSPSSRGPLHAAILIGGGYMVASVLYIWLSGVIVAAASHSVGELQMLETLKGIGFTLVTGGLLFWITYGAMRRLQNEQARYHAHQMAFVESEQRAVIGVLAASFAHDINNMVMVIQAELENAAEASVPAEEDERFVRVRTAVNELVTLARHLREAASQGMPSEKERMNLSGEVRAAIRLIRIHAKVKFCAFEEDIAEVAGFFGNRALINQMVANLVLNAAEAAGPDGKILVRLERHPATAILEVHDDGPGIEEERRGLVFEPFHTTKVQGTGLGLLSVKTCVELHGGRIEISESPLKGALFRVSLPMDG